jgi:hypothetical protein
LPFRKSSRELRMKKLEIGRLTEIYRIEEIEEIVERARENEYGIEEKYLRETR